MTNSTNGPERSPGTNEPKKDASGKPVSPMSGVQNSKSSADCTTSDGSKSSVGGSHVHVEGDGCDPKSGSSSDRNLPRQDDRKPTSTVPPIKSDGFSKSSPGQPQGSGSRPTVGDPVRSGTSHVSSSVTKPAGGATPSPGAPQHASSSPSVSPSSPSRRDAMSPQDPKQFGKGEPVQPDRPKPSQPSHVVEPTIGASAGSAVGDSSN
jgi:hypothetical protein